MRLYVTDAGNVEKTVKESQEELSQNFRGKMRERARLLAPLS